MDLNFSAFQEPRGVMRILHFIFSICAFATITGYTGYISFACNGTAKLEFSYPFSIMETVDLIVSPTNNCSATVLNDFSSDSRFFVATGVLSMLISLAIIVVYIKMDEAYKSNKKLPLYDFLVTVFLAVLWISSSAAWAHALSALKTATGNPIFIPASNCCGDKTGTFTTSFSSLNISVIFGFLNFFLWAADLWFLYKETSWFQGDAPAPPGNSARDVDPSDVSYVFYSRQKIDGVRIHYNEEPDAKHIGDVFNPSLPTVILIHGWQDNYEADSNTYVRTAILSKLNANVIKVDWSPLSRLIYSTARNSVPGVATLAANLLSKVSSIFNYNLSNVYLVGFSLGAHTAGIIGKRLPGRIGTIVALDPAGPGISSSNTDYCVQPSDAGYVQVIHTNGGTLGMSDAVGHSDFYPNGGSRQPGCGIDLIGGCAHNRAWEFFVESVLNNSFVSLGCNSWNNFRSRNCPNGRSLMGGLLAINRNARGLFYLETNSASPYGQGNP
ncbi:phospholipase A1-like [Anthonomus grandis grandis]|uniref:phospholipase A1-like n=1 Tax=Anthonomus grandis grandis TaxID=2921223 RepID=UPI00216686D8|nr:phospholipase A1-like [Anthonomus grandis grandis]